MSNDSTCITRVKLRNYKSIAHCNVPLGALTYLVGPNGAGKSNFLDALRFVADSLRYSLVGAVRDRGGFSKIRRESSPKRSEVELAFDIQVDADTSGMYRFRIGFQSESSYGVVFEECTVRTAVSGQVHFYRKDALDITSSVSSPPAASDDRLYLVSASGLPEFRPIYDALSSMVFYNFVPQRMRGFHEIAEPGALARDGRNLAGVFGRLPSRVQDRIVEYLSKVVPDLTGVEMYEDTALSIETLRFIQLGRRPLGKQAFDAWNMSDGTLRALGVLTALFQSVGSRPSIRLTGIEEPEAALHPSAAAVLRDALNEASLLTQVIVTSHSPDVLDDKDIDMNALLGVSLVNGETRISPIKGAARRAIKARLYTVGELLRVGKLVEEEPFADEGVRRDVSSKISPC